MDQKTIGRYKIVRALGQGGMATVYVAEDPYFKRQVAVKTLPPQNLESPELLSRFRREALTVASLEHPAIVPVYDYGEDGQQPYIVMRLMTGGTLADRLQHRPLSLSQATSIVARLAPALDLAHHRGVVHRDIKPANILFDAEERPYLSDFGIVKLIHQSSTRLTFKGGAIGTPIYMSPEQVAGNESVDGRSDIYSLTVVLYEMLTASIPYAADTPFAVAMMHLQNPVPDISLIRPDLPPECQQIIEYGMAKTPSARFQTAGELAGALTQLMRAGSGIDERIDANAATLTLAEEDLPGPGGPPSDGRGQNADREIQAPSSRSWGHWPSVVAATALLILCGIILISIQPMVGKLRNDWIYLKPQATLTPIASNSEETPATALTTTSTPLASRQSETPQVAEHGPTSSSAIASPSPTLVSLTPTVTGTGILTSATQIIQTAKLLGHTSYVTSLAFFPDGQRLLSGSVDGSLRVWSVSQQQSTNHLTGHTDGIWGVAIAPNGDLVASASADQTVRLWDVTNGTTVRTLRGHSDVVRSVAFSPSDLLVASGGLDGEILLWDTATGERIATLLGHSEGVSSVAFSPSGTQLASGSLDDTIRLWDVSSGQTRHILQGHTDSVSSVAFSPDGRILATGSSDKTVRLWDSASGTLLKTLNGHSGGVNSIAFSPDGLVLVSGAGDESIRLWRVDSGVELNALDGHDHWVLSVAFSSKAILVASGSRDNTITLWGVR